MTIISLEKLLQSRSGPSSDNSSSNALSELVQRARDMGDLTSQLRGELEPNLAQALLAANVRADGELVVVASTSAWAAKIRFEAEKLMRIARSTGTKVSRFRVAVSSG